MWKYTLHISIPGLRLVTKLEEDKSDEVDLFKTNVNKQMKDILGRFKDLQFFTGKSS